MLWDLRRRWVVLLVAVLVVSTALISFTRPAHAASSIGVSVGFDIGWDLSPTTPWADITQDNLFALQTTAGSALDTSFLANDNVPAWVSEVHANGKLAMITIGGSSDQNWQTACDSTYRAAFVGNLVGYMQSNGFDGIDLDIEDDVWAAQGPPSSDMTTCIQAISSAAKAVKTAAGNTPLVSADVITNWEGPWFAPSVAYIDQFNLMTYGDTCTPSCVTFSNDVSATANQGLPTSKMVLGIDVIDSYPPAGDCGNIANYAAQQGLMGVMIWDIHQDSVHNGGPFSCLDQVAPYLSSTPSATATPTQPASTATPTTSVPSPSPTVSPTPSPTPKPTPTPVVINNATCKVLINGSWETGKCSGAFVP